MSKMYEKIKEYYNTGLWSEERVRNMVIKGIITEEEFYDITGEFLNEDEYVDVSENVYICHGSAMVNKSYSLIIEYTKTTDV